MSKGPKITISCEGKTYLLTDWRGPVDFETFLWDGGIRTLESGETFYCIAAILKEIK